jgi:hypothetical protein
MDVLQALVSEVHILISWNLLALETTDISTAEHVLTYA